MKMNSLKEQQRRPACLTGTSDTHTEGRSTAQVPGAEGCFHTVLPPGWSALRAPQGAEQLLTQSVVLSKMQTHLPTTSRGLSILLYLAQYGHAYNPLRKNQTMWFCPQNNICKSVPAPLFYPTSKMWKPKLEREFRYCFTAWRGSIRDSITTLLLLTAFPC